MSSSFEFNESSNSAVHPSMQLQTRRQLVTKLKAICNMTFLTSATSTNGCFGGLLEAGLM
eukprot:5239061-Amphidinium_carterae.1